MSPEGETVQAHMQIMAEQATGSRTRACQGALAVVGERWGGEKNGTVTFK